ncbi:MAG: DUF47 family protein [Candidatus Thermoplasmatota archaeon]|jgi:predicted phosphate transport protein (TIGR00153 family)|nr:DUF47 family protein [Candidatus Thermoplasmatota archaeon]
MKKKQVRNEQMGKKISNRKKLQAKIDNTDMNHIYYDPYQYILNLKPMEAIQEHAKAVHQTVILMKKMFDSYIEEDFENAERYLPKVKEAEFEADNIKSIIRDKLPRSFFSSLTKDDMNSFLKELDSVADSAEDVADYMAARRTKIPDEVKKSFKKHSDIVAQSMNILFDVITDLGRVVKSVFRKKDVDELLQKLHCVSIAEHEADKVKMELRNILFNLEGHDPIAVYHMLKLLQFSDYVADHAENVEGRIRIIVSH